MPALWLLRSSLAEPSIWLAARAVERRWILSRSIHTSRPWLQTFSNGPERPRANNRNRGQHIPFADDGLSTGSDDPSIFANLAPPNSRAAIPAPTISNAGSITNRERAAFASLFDKASRLKNQKSDDVGRKDSLDRLSAGAIQSSPTRTAINVDSFPAPIQDLASRAQDRIDNQQRLEALHVEARKAADEIRKPLQQVADKKDAIVAPLSRIDSLRESHHRYVEKMLASAESDHALWAVLEKEVFEVIAGLHLDKLGIGESKRKQGARRRAKPAAQTGAKQEQLQEKAQHQELGVAVHEVKSRDDMLKLDNATQLNIMGANYPSFLLMAARQLRTQFIGSDLPNHILPTIRSLGRSSYILGASTPLYNVLIDLSWRLDADFDHINTLLMEMENAALDFDEETYSLIYGIRREGFRCLRGEKGESLRGFWKADVVHEGWRKVVAWWPVMQERLGVVNV